MIPPVPEVPRARPAHLGRVLVTGASGFIGGSLLGHAVDRGWTVRAASFRNAVPPGPWELVRVGALSSDTDWRSALEGCDAVVHLGGHVHASTALDKSAHFRVNVQGTRRLAQLAAGAAVRRFLFVSTVKVLGDVSPHERPLNDRDAPAPGDVYAYSKLMAEEILVETAQRTGMEAVILRPPLVYGPGVKAHFLTMMTRIAQGWPLPLGALHSRRSFCFLGNLHDAMLTILEHPEAVGRRFLVGDGNTLPLAGFASRLGQALGRPARLVSIPAGLLKMAGRLVGKSEQVCRLTESLEVDISGIQQTLDWRPPWSIDAGIAKTTRWYWSCHGR